MDEDRCENCYWFWSTIGSERECQMYPKPKVQPCGFYEDKLHQTEIDEYEQYQNEWN